jgi:hypothetical protein
MTLSSVLKMPHDELRGHIMNLSNVLKSPHDELRGHIMNLSNVLKITPCWTRTHYDFVQHLKEEPMMDSDVTL